MSALPFRGSRLRSRQAFARSFVSGGHGNYGPSLEGWLMMF